MIVVFFTACFFFLQLSTLATSLGSCLSVGGLPVVILVVLIVTMSIIYVLAPDYY